MSRALVWRGLDGWRAEYADVWLRDGRLVARGVQVGVEPFPYEARYSLDTSPGYDTAHLSVNASGAGWSRHLDLRRDRVGSWDISVGSSGEVDLPEPGGNPAEFDGARDCDLEHCPVTNAMPVLREGLLDGGKPVNLVMAWVALPALTVRRSDQRYEPLGSHRVRYVALDSDFPAELELDEDGLVVSYPGMAERVAGAILSGAVKRYHLTTFGCQMNEHDSERMKGMLDSLGYGEVTDRADADLILFNTCSIREKADNRLVGHLGEARRLKREHPERVIGIGGCWSQSMKERVFEQFPFVDVAFGPGQVHRLAEFLTSDSLSAQGYFEFEGFTGHLPAKRAREFQGWVQISVGCNCVCSYCIVPSTRGREVSRPAAELLAEVERLAADGVREVTLLGQNVNSYGRDLPKGEKTSFSELLALVDAVDGVERVRYTSPHPKDMKEDVIRAHAELPSLCEHIHLPLQSGSSRLLKAMRRTYDQGRYLDRVAMIRELVPDCAITTDIIVGFPGETEEDFQATLDVVEQARYDSAFTFIFSPRRGTEAATLPDPVAREVQKERMGRLVDAVQRIAAERAQRFVGRTMDVLVEGPSRTDPSRLRGRIRHNKTVHFSGVAAPGELTAVEIRSATSTTLAGEEPVLARAAG